MWQLARNDKAALLKDSNGEYWYIDFAKEEHNFGCYNVKGHDYNAMNALEAFEKQFGPATYKHKNIEMH